ncbi:MAG: NAD-dependent epimerase/dehydratase family protein [Leptolyngbya sp. PLA3]|nr:MAG: NAD-dependent epimerase/dehydratase family protein [Cyanobacteria bacterium CYA]MCE7969516.1 NAD-dependent epimerase/dehydratase family protein [Leptolyngbya sp. PL-A3]
MPQQVPQDAGSGARRTLVSGGSGFIGSHLVARLLERGDRVTVVDDLSTGRRANLPEEHPRLRFIEATVKDAIHVFGPGERFDEIYHLAAAVGVQLVLEDPIRSIETNVEQTSAVLRFATRCGPEAGPARVLITSSSEVYGKPPSAEFCEDDDVLYGPTTVLRWSYAQTKAIDEYLGLAHHARLGVPVVVVRLFNTVGPRQVGSYGMVLPRFVAAALRGDPLEVYGDGTQSRCFCDVRDVVEVLPRLLEQPRCHGRVFNVGSDEPISIGDLARLVIQTLGSSSEIRHVPYASVYPDGFEDLHRRRPSLERVRTAVNFRPGYSLRQTIVDLASSLREGLSAGEGIR